MQIELTQRDIMFRKFQIHKYRNESMVPTVTMTVYADSSRMLELKNAFNKQYEGSKHITITHIAAKAVSDCIKNYPLLFSFFYNNEIIENQELVLNIPVDFENHVEYIALHNPDAKILEDISEECTEELSMIRSGNGTFFNVMKNWSKKPNDDMKSPIEFVRKHLGNFVISNFGSFHADSGTILLAQPVVAGLCIGSLRKSACLKNGQWTETALLPLTLSFDHRPVDGAYAGRFLSDLKNTLENPQFITDELN